MEQVYNSKHITKFKQFHSQNFRHCSASPDWATRGKSQISQVWDVQKLYRKILMKLDLNIFLTIYHARVSSFWKDTVYYSKLDLKQITVGFPVQWQWSVF